MPSGTATGHAYDPSTLLFRVLNDFSSLTFPQVDNFPPPRRVDSQIQQHETGVVRREQQCKDILQSLRLALPNKESPLSFPLDDVISGRSLFSILSLPPLNHPTISKYFQSCVPNSDAS